MCWCPITGFDSADLGHEWSMGVTRTDLSDEMQGYSDALALESYGSEVDFETVWGQGHTQAERSGDSTDNFIEWVNSLWK